MERTRFYFQSLDFFYNSIRLRFLPLYDSPRARRVEEGLQPLSDSRYPQTLDSRLLFAPLTPLTRLSLASRLSLPRTRLVSLFFPLVGPTTVGRDQGEREATKGTTPLFPILGLCSYGRNSGGHYLQLRPLS